MIALLAALLGCSGGAVDSAAVADDCEAPGDISGLPDIVGYHGPMTVSIGGLVYEDVYQFETAVIEGWAVLGLDTLGDGYIDCRATGNFVARLSGR